MNSYFANLNPAERRLLIFVSIAVFFVVNYFFVWPHFSDWNTLQGKLAQARQKQSRNAKAIHDYKAIEPKLRDLERDGNVPAEDQATEFLNRIQVQSGQSGIGSINYTRQITRTNDQFFLERIQTISVVSGEKQLVDFILNLSSNSFIRVSSFSAHPADPQRQQLSASITLVGSYQKKPSVRPAAAPAAKPQGTVPKTPAPSAPSPPPAAKPEAGKPATPKKK